MRQFVGEGVNKLSCKAGLLILAVSIVLSTALSCRHQQDLIPELTQSSQKSSQHEYLPTKTQALQATPIPTLTLTQTPTENNLGFENCINNELRVGVFNSGPLLSRSDIVKESDVVQDEEGWKIEVGEIEILLKQIKTEKGYTYFSIDETILSVTDGALVDIYFNNFTNFNNDEKNDVYKFGIFTYSPTTNDFIIRLYAPLPPYLSIYVDIYANNVLSISCVSCFQSSDYEAELEVAEEYIVMYIDLNKNEQLYPEYRGTVKCVTYVLSNGNQYYWGINKSGEVIWPEMREE